MGCLYAVLIVKHYLICSFDLSKSRIICDAAEILNHNSIWKRWVDLKKLFSFFFRLKTYIINSRNSGKIMSRNDIILNSFDSDRSFKDYTHFYISKSLLRCFYSLGGFMNSDIVIHDCCLNLLSQLSDAFSILRYIACYSIYISQTSQPLGFCFLFFQTVLIMFALFS